MHSTLAEANADPWATECFQITATTFGKFAESFHEVSLRYSSTTRLPWNLAMYFWGLTSPCSSLFGLSIKKCPFQKLPWRNNKKWQIQIRFLLNSSSSRTCAIEHSCMTGYRWVKYSPVFEVHDSSTCNNAATNRNFWTYGQWTPFTPWFIYMHQKFTSSQISRQSAVLQKKWGAHKHTNRCVFFFDHAICSCWCTGQPELCSPTKFAKRLQRAGPTAHKEQRLGQNSGRSMARGCARLCSVVVPMVDIFRKLHHTVSCKKTSPECPWRLQGFTCREHTYENNSSNKKNKIIKRLPSNEQATGTPEKVIC